MNYNDHALADLQVYPMNHLHQMVEHSQRHRRASARYAIASLRVLPVHLRLPSLVNPSLLGRIELYMVNASPAASIFAADPFAICWSYCLIDCHWVPFDRGRG